MQIKKRLMSLLLSLTFIFASIPSAFAATDSGEWDAEMTLAQTPVCKNASVATEVINSIGQVVEVGGRSAWKMTPNSWYYNSIFVKLKGKKPAGGTNLLVEVDYYDMDDRGWFMLEYDSRDKKSIYTERVNTTGLKKWKTAQFTLFAPALSGGTAASQHSGDFAITTERPSYESSNDVYIGAIRVKYLDTNNSADATIEFTKQPKNYYSHEDVEFDLTLVEKAGKSYTADMKYSVVDSYGKTVYVQEDKIDLKSLGVVNKRVKLDLDNFGRHTLFVEGKCEELGYHFETHKEFAYIKKSAYISQRVGACNHFVWQQMDRDPDIIYPMYINAGMGIMRDEVYWHLYEKTKGVRQLTEWDDNWLTKAGEYGVDLLICLNDGNPLYGSPVRSDVSYKYVMTDEWLADFTSAMHDMVEDIGDRVTNYEYWNEYGWGGVDYDWYHKLAKATWDGVMSANPNANTVGICNAGIGTWIIDASFPQGAEHHMHDVSYHTYSNDSPENQDAHGDVSKIRACLDKYETGDEKGIWLTEYGWRTDLYTYNEAAEYMVRQIAMQSETGLVDKFYWYDFTNDGADGDNWGGTFGMTECFAQATGENRFLAKPAYIATANFTDLLGNHLYQDKIFYENDDAKAYWYKRSEDGKDVAICWSESENQVVNLDLGTDDIEAYDIYGNPVEVTSKDGNFVLNLTGNPVYLTGEFKEFKKGETQVYVSQSLYKACPKDTLTVGFYKTTNQNATIEIGELEADSKTKILKKPEFKGKIANLVLKLDSESGNFESIPVKVTLDDGTVCYDGVVRIEYVDTYDLSASSRLYSVADTSRWVIDLNLTSYYSSDKVTATMDIVEPKQLEKKNIKLGTLKPGENKIRVHLPEVTELSNYQMKVVIKDENGIEANLEMPIDFGLAFKAKTPPTIDGNFDEGEWPQNARIVSNRLEQYITLIASEPWRGAEDNSCDTYVLWDDENCYFCFVVTDDTHYNIIDDATIWQYDSIQFGCRFDLEQKQGQDNSLRTELGLALGKDDKLIIHQYDKETGIEGNFENCELKVGRVGKKTVYEFKAPWTDIVPAGVEVKEGTDLRFTVAVNDNDSTGRKGAMCFANGIVESKDPNKYGRVKLMP